MASYNPAVVARPAAYGAPIPGAAAAAAAAPGGTFAPGTKIQVGSHKVVIQQYFSEGGFAHVYLVKMPQPIDGTDIAVLKRVAVPDREALANMRTEVETMKKLKGHRPIVTYYDSHASQLKGGGYEVFLLMEFCSGGGLIDFMNTRLQKRLTEPEILKIFSDVTEGVACMHYLKPPLLHRDLKVENVLIASTTGGARRFKLCDFGSTAPPRPAAKTAAECRLIEEDVQKHTTLQYRSPEMIDVYRKQPINEKSDIWALGVLLYKLCYYTTPFEDQGQLAILNASFKYPAHPTFSERLKKLIASMLRENPQARPNVYQVLREACLMQGIEVPIRDIYAGRTESESRRNERLPSSEPGGLTPPTIGVVFSPPTQPQRVIPEVVPMRRGRPTTTPQSHGVKQSPSPLRGTSSDPFAALDANAPPLVASDDIAARFPSLDQFSLLHDQGAKFEFDGPSSAAPSRPRDLSQRVIEKLADDAFVTPTPIKTPSAAHNSSSAMSRAQKIISSNPALQEAISSPSAPTSQPPPAKPTMVSEGTMTSPTELPSDPRARKYARSPLDRLPDPDHHRSASVPRNSGTAGSSTRHLRSEEIHPPREASLSVGMPFSSEPKRPAKHASSSRPSLESGRPSSDALEPVARRQSVDTRPRPSSTHLDSNIDYLREQESTGARPGFLGRYSSSHLRDAEAGPAGANHEDESSIESNVEFLRTMEDPDGGRRGGRRISIGTKQAKRSSLPSMSLSGTKSLLAGKFGDAFKRFEQGPSAPAGPRTPSPLQPLHRRDLTPIAGSEATDGRSDDGQVLEEMDDMSPETKREVERRRLSMEERRVADAAAEYRQRLADRDAGGAAKFVGGMTKAASIQQKVKTLLDDNQKPSSSKTAEGYGRYTDGAASQQARPYDDQPPHQFPRPSTARKPIARSGGAGSPPLDPPPGQGSHLGRSIPFGSERVTHPAVSSTPTFSASPTSSTNAPHRSATLASRPSAPPKPTHLNSLSTGPTASSSSSHQHPSSLSSSPPKPSISRPSSSQVGPDMTPAERDDYIQNFSKRFPSLSGIEMVETVVGKDGKQPQQ